MTATINNFIFNNIEEEYRIVESVWGYFVVGHGLVIEADSFEHAETILNN